MQSDDQFPLLEAAASLAQDEEPTLDVQQVLDDVARLVKRVKARMPEAWDERRDRGLVHAELGHVHEALQDLRQYLEAVPAAPDTAALRNRVSELSAL